MLFPTLNFALFFLVVFFVAWGLKDRPQARKWFLVLASYGFYAAWNWHFLALLAGSSVGNYTAGRWIAASVGRRRRWIVGGAVALNLALLGYFKYCNFFLQSLNDLLFALGFSTELPMGEILLPVAISFFTFHGISYVVDVHRGKVAPCRAIVDLLLYISFFPQLVAGPIVRAAHFLPQLAHPLDPADIPFTRSLLLILIGLFKKVVVANALATQLVDPVLLYPTGHGAVEMLFATWGYALQIYCDFSAYTDIATGVALLLGYHFPANFNQPYRARSLQDFWRRWHMSLSSWLKEYLYIPLGGSRASARRTAINLLITMFLGGIWHGANWTFLVWGLFHGLALVVERWMQGRTSFRPSPALSVFVVFHCVCFAWIFFRAPDLATALAGLAAFGDWSSPLQNLTPFLAGLVLLGLASQFLPPDLLDRTVARLERLPFLLQGAASGFVVVAIDAFGPEGVAPFIYFQF